MGWSLRSRAPAPLCARPIPSTIACLLPLPAHSACMQTEGEVFMQLLLAALKAITRRVLLADQSVEYMLKADP